MYCWDNVAVQPNSSDGQGHNQLSQCLANVDSESGTTKPSHEIGNASNLSCTLHEFQLHIASEIILQTFVKCIKCRNQLMHNG
jgi:hypothetical protein